MDMQKKYPREYTARHERIRNKLLEMAKSSDCGCFPVIKIASELSMDQRTVRAHLKIIEIDNAGVFLDPKEKEFCTREGLILLAKRLGAEGISGESEAKDVR
jgi:DNA-binding transcriptional ArsR family regulator